MLIFAVLQPIASVLSRAVNWFLDAFYPQSGTIAETSWQFRFIAGQAGESAVPILLGLLIGLWLARHRATSEHF